MSRPHLTTLAVAFTLTAALAVASAAVASAKDRRAVRVAGVCTENSSAKLKLSREDGRIEVEFEVDQNRNGIPWKVTVRRSGVVVASTTATTHAPSGSFVVRRVIARTLATEHITAVATRSSGERCTARAAF